MADQQMHEPLTSDEEHSVLEDDSDDDQRENDYLDDDDGSSELSIPNESIDFDLVYALHSFAATVDGQANVVKGDSLFLMDDSNSYWWLVRVLKTQEVGYIPAENIETPFERLARLNKHRNVDLASATQAELQLDVHASRDRLRANARIDAPSPTSSSDNRTLQHRRSVIFTPGLSVHRYPPAVWNEEEEEDEDVEWDDEGYEDEDPDLAEEARQRRQAEQMPLGMEPDDGMSWEDGAVDAIRSGPNAGALLQGLRAGPRAQQPVQEQSGQQPLSLRTQVSGSESSLSPATPTVMDPEHATDTVKLIVTPTIARDGVLEQQQHASSAAQAGASGPMLPSAIMQQQEQDRKRTREEIEALEEAARKKASLAPARKDRGPAPASGAPSAAGAEARPAGGKLRKEREPVSGDEDGGKDRKKKGGMLSGLFGRKKDKDKGKDRSDTDSLRESEESGRSSQASAQIQSGARQSPTRGYTETMRDPMGSPVTEAARQQQVSYRNSTNPRQGQSVQGEGAVQEPQTPQRSGQGPAGTASPLSQSASSLRNHDRQQQALYQRYLHSSPASPPEAQPSYGLQSAAAMGHSTSINSSASVSSTGLSPAPERRPRPGSLVLSTMEGNAVAAFTELSVIRVFAGENVQTEATFKTVLLNNSTTSGDLVRQALQRFRLPAGEDEHEYFLTVKQVEGSSTVLEPLEKPLVVFETLVEAAMELPKVKRSSVGSMSSIASNLSMHPAIKKLPMNDFTDDSAVKFYLNRRSSSRADDPFGDNEGDETIIARDNDADPTASKIQYLSVSSVRSNPLSDRFSSPSYRFPAQLVIYPEDLPDDMVFDPMTEAIIFKHTLRNRGGGDRDSRASGISQTQRRKVFVFPKNVTVAEVIELGLERFGILEGVVDGGDEVEDKSTKRRSTSRVRYTLHVEIGGQERELSPSHKVIDAFPRPPTLRAAVRPPGDGKRRSMDLSQLMGTPDDIQPNDPVFILRRAVAYRNSSSRHRISAPLDEIALQHLQRDLVSSGTESSIAEEAKQRHMSKQELIAAQRAASRANQRAIVTAQTNSVRGVDVLLPGNAMLRSSRYEVDDRMRYSYVDGDGETYDISDIVEEEWQEEFGQRSPGTGANRNDLLQGVLVRNKDAIGDKLDRVLNKVKQGKSANDSEPGSANSARSLASMQSSASSSYSDDQMNAEVRVGTPTARAEARSITPSGTRRTTQPASEVSDSRSATPVNRARAASPTSARASPLARPTSGADHQQQPSIASVLSDISAYGKQAAQRESMAPTSRAPSALKKHRPVIPKDDFGLSHMMAIIELDAILKKPPPPPPLDPVDEMLFGRPVDLDKLHPDIQKIYSPAFKQLEEMDQMLDDMLQVAMAS